MVVSWVRRMFLNLPGAHVPVTVGTVSLTNVKQSSAVSANIRVSGMVSGHVGPVNGTLVFEYSTDGIAWTPISGAANAVTPTSYVINEVLAVTYEPGIQVRAYYNLNYAGLSSSTSNTVTGIYDLWEESMGVNDGRIAETNIAYNDNSIQLAYDVSGIPAGFFDGLTVRAEVNYQETDFDPIYTIAYEPVAGVGPGVTVVSTPSILIVTATAYSFTMIPT